MCGSSSNIDVKAVGILKSIPIIKKITNNSIVKMKKKWEQWFVVEVKTY